MRWRGRASDMQVSRTHRERAHLNAASSIHHWTRSIHSMWRPTIFCMRRLQRWLEGDISMMTYSNRQNNFAVSTNYIIGFLMSELLWKNIIMNAMNASYSFVFLTIFVVDEWAGDTPSDGYDLKSELSLFATSLLLRNEHMASDFQNTMHSANWNELFEWGKHFVLFTLQLCSKLKKKIILLAHKKWSRVWMVHQMSMMNLGYFQHQDSGTNAPIPIVGFNSSEKISWIRTSTSTLNGKSSHARKPIVINRTWITRICSDTFERCIFQMLASSPINRILRHFLQRRMRSNTVEEITPEQRLCNTNVIFVQKNSIESSIFGCI